MYPTYTMGKVHENSTAIQLHAREAKFSLQYHLHVYRTYDKGLLLYRHGINCFYHFFFRQNINSKALNLKDVAPQLPERDIRIFTHLNECHYLKPTSSAAVIVRAWVRRSARLDVVTSKSSTWSNQHRLPHSYTSQRIVRNTSTRRRRNRTR